MRQSNGSGSFASVRTCVLGMGRILGVGLSSVAAAPLTEKKHGGDELEGTPAWVLYVASMVLVLLGGAFAGLTIAYVGNSPLGLRQLFDNVVGDD